MKDQKQKRGVGRPTKYDPAMLERMQDFGAQGMSKAEMAVELEINRSTFTDWEANNPDFSAAVKEAVAKAQAWWERKGREATFNSKDFNSTSYIFNMKNRFSEDWRDRKEIEHNGDMTVEIISYSDADEENTATE